MYYQKYIVQDVIESYNNYMKPDRIVDYLHLYDILSRCVLLEDIIKNNDLPWNRDYLSWNPKLKENDSNEINRICSNLRGEWFHERFYNVKWKTFSYSTDDLADLIKSLIEGNPAANVSNVVLDNEIIRYRWHGQYKEITLHMLSGIIDMEVICMYPDFPWNLCGLSENHKLTMEILALHLPNCSKEWNPFASARNVIDLNYTIINSTIRGDIVEVIFNGSIVKFDKATLFERNDIKGHLMVHMNHVDASMIMNNIHLPWNFNRIITADNVPLRLALLGKRIKSVFTPIKFTEMYHDIDIFIN
ncbi:hypothetical protein D3C87_858690 [compost metagenome]